MRRTTHPAVWSGVHVHTTAKARLADSGDLAVAELAQAEEQGASSGGD